MPNKNELTFEQVQAQYFDDDALLEAQKPLYRMDGSGNRYYYHLSENGNPTFYISVTSMIGATMPMGYGFNQWLKNNTAEESDYKRDSRAAFGTMMHIDISELTINRKYNLDEIGYRIDGYCEREGFKELAGEWQKELTKNLLSFANFMQERNVVPIAVEVGLASRSMGLAGSIDIVCELDWNGKRVTAIVDMKSGNVWPSHAVQLEAYKRIWNENFPNRKVTHLFNWTGKDWRSKPTYNLKNQTNSKHIDKLDSLLQLWKIDNPNATPPSLLQWEGEINLEKDLSNNYSTLSVEEIVKNRHNNQ